MVAAVCTLPLVVVAGAWLCVWFDCFSHAGRPKSKIYKTRYSSSKNLLHRLRRPSRSVRLCSLACCCRLSHSLGPQNLLCSQAVCQTEAAYALQASAAAALETLQLQQSKQQEALINVSSFTSDLWELWQKVSWVLLRLNKSCCA